MEDDKVAAVPTAAPSEAARYTLVCDYGSLWTKGTLVGDVDGTSRLLATCAAPTPTDDAGRKDLRAATLQIAEKLRSLTGIPSALPADAIGGEQLEVSLIPVGSATPAMRIVLIAPDGGSARRAASLLEDASYIESIRAGTVSELLEDAGLAVGPRPDAVILIEARSGIPQAEVRSLAQLLARTGVDTRLVPMIHCRPGDFESPAGGLLRRLEPEVVLADLTGKGSYGSTAARRALNLLYSERALTTSAGVLGLPLSRRARFVSAAGAEVITAKFAAGARSDKVAVLDVGGSNTTACYVDGEELRYSVASGCGVGAGAAALYGRVGEAKLQQWLPFAPRPDELRAWALNRAVQPLTLPRTLREVFIEQAFVREALCVGLEGIALTTPPDLVIGCGALARGMRPQVSAVLLVDALNVCCPSWQQVGLAVDTSNLVPALGAVAAVDPELAARVWELDAPRGVATAVAARGARAEGPAASAVMRWEGGEEETAVAGGQLKALQPPYGVTAQVELKAMPGVRLAGAGKRELVSLELSPSVAYPLPQVLLDTRPVLRPGGSRRTDLVATYLISSGAFGKRDLESL